MAHIELNFHHYRHNLELLAQKCGSMKKLMVVLKNNAYGHGLSQMAPLAAAVGVQYAAVKDCAEGKKIEGLFQSVLVLSDVPQDSSCAQLVFAAHSLEALANFPCGTRVHLNVDTGMHRNGVEEGELEKAFLLCQKNNLLLEGVFTHFHSADALGSDYFVQRRRFASVKDAARLLATRYGFATPLFHSCNSAGLLRHHGVFEDDIARVGIASYGYVDLPELLGVYGLKPVLSVWANRMSSRTLKSGQKIGYGGTYEATRPMAVSTYDMGYGDGLFRLGGQKGVCIDGGLPVLGRISMDSFTVEADKEQVCVFKDASAFAKGADTITYEVLTRLSPWLRRHVVGRDE